MSSTTPQIQIYHDVSAMPMINNRIGGWQSQDTGSSGCGSEKPFTAGIYRKDELAEDVSFTNWPTTEWKYVLEGEWHIIQNGQRLIAKPGDVVFVPKGCNYTSVGHPFKAFFVSNRATVNHKPYQ